MVVVVGHESVFYRFFFFFFAKLLSETWALANRVPAHEL